MKKPTLNEAKKNFLQLSINTRETAYSLYSKDQDKFINHIEAKNKELIEVYDEYIKLLGESLSRHGAFIISQPYMKMDSQEDVDKGAELRAKIENLKTNKK